MLGLTLTICTILLCFFKRISLEKTTFFILLAHSCIGLVLQFFGIFTGVTVAIFYVILLAVLLVISKNKSWIILNNKGIGHSPTKLIFIGFAIAAVAGMALSFVHFNYNGVVSTTKGAEYAVNMTYPYPIFSDEWVAVEVINETIHNQTLPVSDVFFGKPVFNFLFGFHSFISELHLFFDINPLYGYVYFSVIISVLTILIAWRLLSVIGIFQPIAVFTSLMLLYVTTGSNLPGLWYLLPWNMGFIFLLLTYIFLVKKEYVFAAFSIIFGSFMYPPLTLFFAFVGVGFFIKKAHCLKFYRYVKNKTIIFLFVGAIITLTCLFSEAVRDVILLGFQYVVRPLNSVAGVAPSFYIWTIVPIISLIGFLFSFQKKNREVFSFMLYPAIGGCVLWTIYLIGFPTVIIDYHRVVSITGLHIVIISALGLQALMMYFISYFDYNFEVIKKHSTTAVVVIICIFLLLNIGYTNRNNWALLEKRVWQPSTQSYYIIKPRPPVNSYMQEDDLRIFSEYEGKRFLAPAWKSLVIAAATENIPLETKPATFTIKEFSLNKFMKLSCEEKVLAAEKYEIDLVYSSSFICEGFVEVDTSEEGGFLYEFQGDIL